jgi:hypothetical protein
MNPLSNTPIVLSAVEPMNKKPLGQIQTIKNNDPIIAKEGANKQVISSQADSLIKISRIWADFFPANTSNQPI